MNKSIRSIRLGRIVRINTKRVLVIVGGICVAIPPFILTSLRIIECWIIPFMLSFSNCCSLNVSRWSRRIGAIKKSWHGFL
jgi:hypothetical protein